MNEKDVTIFMNVKVHNKTAPGNKTWEDFCHAVAWRVGYVSCILAEKEGGTWFELCQYDGEDNKRHGAGSFNFMARDFEPATKNDISFELYNAQKT